MKPIDSRLLDQLDAASEEDEVEALVVVDRKRSDLDEDEEAGRLIVEQAVESTHQEPSKVLFLRTLGVLYVKGPERVLREILKDDRVISASANADDFFVPGDS